MSISIPDRASISGWNLIANGGAERKTAGWFKYSGDPSTEPADMSPSDPPFVFTTTSTSGEVLNGNSSFKLYLDSLGTYQGGGVACLVPIPPAYRGRTLTFKAPFKVVGNIVEDDLKLYAYDVTNSKLITPISYGKILGERGEFLCTFPVDTDCEQLRVGIHIAGTSSEEVTLLFDDVSLGIENVAKGLAGSNWQDFTPTGSWTTNTIYTGKWRRVGDTAEIQYRIGFTGTPNSTRLYVNLPDGLFRDASKTPVVDFTPVGIASANDSGTAAYVVFPAIIPGDPLNQIRVACLAAASGSIKDVTQAVPATWTSVDSIYVTVKIPIAGWDANVTMAESSQFWISSYLANGTRVTTTPKKLGEYRVYKKSAANNLGSGVDNAPAVPPTAKDGFLLYGNVPYNSAGTSGQPTRVEMYIGEGKNFTVKAYKDAGKKFEVQIDQNANYHDNGEYGVRTSYKEGVLVIDAMSLVSASSIFRNIGYAVDTDGGERLAVPYAYIDVLVYNDARAVGIESNVDRIRLYGSSGHGSTANKVRRFATLIEIVGSAITLTQSSSQGDSFTINQSGVYAITYSDASSGGNYVLGITADCTQLTTAPSGITAKNLLAASYGPNGLSGSITVTEYLPAGTVVRAQTDGVPNADDYRVRFTIQKVGN